MYPIHKYRAFGDLQNICFIFKKAIFTVQYTKQLQLSDCSIFNMIKLGFWIMYKTSI